MTKHRRRRTGDPGRQRPLVGLACQGWPRLLLWSSLPARASPGAVVDCNVSPECPWRMAFFRFGGGVRVRRMLPGWPGVPVHPSSGGDLPFVLPALFLPRLDACAVPASVRLGGRIVREAGWRAASPDGRFRRVFASARSAWAPPASAARPFARRQQACPPVPRARSGWREPVRRNALVARVPRFHGQRWRPRGSRRRRLGISSIWLNGDLAWGR